REIRRIDGNECQPRERGAELQQYPFGAVGCPYRDVVAGTKTSQQCAGHRLGLVEQRRECPAAARRGLRQAVHQRHAVAPPGSGVAQRIADRAFQHGLRVVRRPMGTREWNACIGHGWISTRAFLRFTFHGSRVTMADNSQQTVWSVWYETDYVTRGPGAADA